MKDKDLVVAFGCLGAPIHIGSNKESRFNGNTQYTAMLKALVRNPNIRNVILMGALGAETEKSIYGERMLNFSQQEQLKKVKNPR